MSEEIKGNEEKREDILPKGFKTQKFEDDEIKVLVFFMKNSNHKIYMPMLWKHMKDFLNNNIIPNFGWTNAPLRLFGKVSAVEGIKDEQLVGQLLMQELAGWAVADPNDDMRDERLRAEDSQYRSELLKLQRKNLELLEKYLDKGDEGDEWKKKDPE